jgi:hypothetical protein
MSVLDWPADAAMSPFELVPWQKACSDLGVSSDTLTKLFAKHGLGIVRMSTRKRAVIARDLLILINQMKRPAATYAVAQPVTQ